MMCIQTRRHNYCRSDTDAFVLILFSGPQKTKVSDQLHRIAMKISGGPAPALEQSSSTVQEKSLPKSSLGKKKQPLVKDGSKLSNGNQPSTSKTDITNKQNSDKNYDSNTDDGSGSKQVIRGVSNKRKHKQSSSESSDNDSDPKQVHRKVYVIDSD